MSSVPVTHNTHLLTQVKDHVCAILEDYLPEFCSFHDLKHTEQVVAFCQECAEYYQIEAKMMEELLIAAWFHDTGFTRKYYGHEQESAVLAESFLNDLKLNKERIANIKDLILSTHKDHKSQNLLQEILHDADTQHLGKKSFFKRGALLRQELEVLHQQKEPNHDWEFNQYHFLLNHKFQTEYAQQKLAAQWAKNIRSQKGQLLESLRIPYNPLYDKASRGIETMYRVSYRSHMNLSAIADRKANMMISINSIILSAILAVVGSGFAFLGNQEIAYYRFSIPIGVLLIFSLLSGIYAILSAKPHVTHNLAPDFNIDKDKKSILYFGNFTMLPLEDYVDDMEILRHNDQLLYDNMSIDIYNLGVVLKKKYSLLKWSYSLFMIGLIMSVVSLIGVLIYSTYISTNPIF